MTLSVVILAAGKGTRMFSEKPKVLHQLSNQPLLQYVINAAKKLSPLNINVVIGYESELIKQEFSKENINWVIQKEQLGTGDAVKYTTPFLEGSQTIVLYGDVPLVNINDLKKLLKISENKLGILTFDKENPKGYGRIKRIEDEVVEIVEDKDCSEVEKKIKEINTGIMCIDTSRLIQWLSKIKNNNSQKEYYLTDIVDLAKKDRIKIETYKAKDESTISGINSKVELIAMDDSEIKYSTVQNWFPGSPDGKGGVFNFVTKRGLCEKNAKISWTQVETGSAVTWKYPSCILKGDNSIGEFYSIAVTNNYQQADTGTKMIHIGKNTKSTIISKGISAGKSQNSYRGLVKINSRAENARNFSQCDSLLMGNECGAHTFPYIEAKNKTAQIEHEATTSKIGEDQIFYCNQRGIDTEKAIALIVNGFSKDVLNKLPMEFAVEAQKLLEISLEGSVG